MVYLLGLDLQVGGSQAYDQVVQVPPVYVDLAWEAARGP